MSAARNFYTASDPQRVFDKVQECRRALAKMEQIDRAGSEEEFLDALGHFLESFRTISQRCYGVVEKQSGRPRMKALEAQLRLGGGVARSDGLHVSDHAFIRPSKRMRLREKIGNLQKGSRPAFLNSAAVVWNRKMADERKPAVVTIPSDGLRALLDLRNEFPVFRQLFGDIVQTVMVLDASAIQGELRWRLGSRTNPAARTGLHEAIDSGVVIAFAPIFLRQEIEKYLLVIASETGVTLETASAEWQRVQSLIRFYAPIGDGTKFALVDPKDSDYVLTWQELDADFVRTGDYRHFTRMGATVIGAELDAVLRDYARSTSVLVTVKLGSGFVVTIGIQALDEMIRGIVEMFRKMPPAVRLILGIVVAALILHPGSRAKIAEWAKTIWDRLRETKPVLVSISREAVKHLAEAAQTSIATGNEIKSRLRLRGTQTALSHLRLICLRSKEPLSEDEIARRILANGYSSRSKTFTAYVRRLLKQDGRFVTNADGLWMLRSAA